MYQPDKLSDLLSPPVAPVKVNPIAQRLLDAAQRIRERGWTQGQFCTDAGSVCLLGAIYDARPGGFMSFHPESICANNALARRGFDPDWNDAPGRTADEVIAALESVAAELQAGGNS